MVSTTLTILPDRLFVQQNSADGNTAKRQITPMQYSIMAPVIFTANLMNGSTSVENVTQAIRNIDVSANRSEIIGFNAVGMLRNNHDADSLSYT